MKMKVNDFFCGAGGVGLGFMNAGYDVIWACDYDKFAVQTYRHNVGDHVIQADIKELSYKDIPHADIWAFGFPCQDLSVAGKQAGFKLSCKDCKTEWSVGKLHRGDVMCPNCAGKRYQAESRSALFFEMMRLIDETHEFLLKQIPSALFIENVKGLTPFIPAVQNQLEIRGYTVHIQLYNSKYWGVPQNRERYFIIGLQKNISGFEFPEEQHDYIPKLSTILEENINEKYYIADEKAQTIIGQALERLEELSQVHPTITPNRENKRQNGRRAKENESEMFTLTAQDIHGVIINEGESVEDSENTICKQSGLLFPDGCGKTLRDGGSGSLSKKT